MSVCVPRQMSMCSCSSQRGHEHLRPSPSGTAPHLPGRSHELQQEASGCCFSRSGSDRVCLLRTPGSSPEALQGWTPLRLSGAGPPSGSPGLGPPDLPLPLSYPSQGTLTLWPRSSPLSPPASTAPSVAQASFLSHRLPPSLAPTSAQSHIPGPFPMAPSGSFTFTWCLH